MLTLTSYSYWFMPQSLYNIEFYSLYFQCETVGGISETVSIAPLELEKAKPALFSSPHLKISLGQNQYTTSDAFVADVFVQDGLWLSNWPMFDFDVIEIQQWKNNAWNIIRKDMNCPCGASCKKGKTRVALGDDTKSFSWDFKDDHCNTVASGKYRVVIPDNLRRAAVDSNPIVNTNLAISEEFTVCFNLARWNERGCDT